VKKRTDKTHPNQPKKKAKKAKKKTQNPPTHQLKIIINFFNKNLEKKKPTRFN
jgi:hypothetical protein